MANIRAKTTAGVRIGPRHARPGAAGRPVIAFASAAASDDGARPSTIGFLATFGLPLARRLTALHIHIPLSTPAATISAPPGHATVSDYHRTRGGGVWMRRMA